MDDNIIDSPTVSVVIIGGSNAGIGVSHALLKQIPHDAITVTLINPSTEYYFNIAAPRVLAWPAGDDWSIARDKYIYSIPALFQQYPAETFRFIQGTAERIDPDSKTITVNRRDESAAKATSVIHYDYLVIASGSTTASTLGQDSLPAPFKAPLTEDLDTAIAKTQAALQSAKSIIIGGAGPVGVEFAAELSEAFERRRPDQPEITLLSASDAILPGLPANAQSAAHHALTTSKGVVVKTNSKVERAELDRDLGKWSVELASGETLIADLYVSATGCVPNNQFIPTDWLDAQGWVDVDENLRVLQKGASPCPRVYALGDISSHQIRTLMRVPAQVATVVSGLRDEIVGEGNVVPYVPEQQWDMMFVPIGRYAGTGMVQNYTLWGWVVALVKGRDFLASRASAYIMG